MNAKCAECQHEFETDVTGQQFCPRCGAAVMVDEPVNPEQSLQPPPSSSHASAAAPMDGPVPGAGASSGERFGPGGSTPGGGSSGAAGGQGSGGFGGPGGGGWLPPAPPPQDWQTPWEERAERGLLFAFVETVKLSLFQPASFFERMRVDNANGALSYYWINAAFGALVGYFWQAAMAMLGVGFGNADLMGGADNPLAAAFDQRGPFFYIIFGVMAAVLAPIGLYLSAGIIHLGALLFKSAGNGFNATLRTVAYASGPNLLNVIPFCGSFIASIWTLVLIVIGLWKTQRSSAGAAVGAVLLPMFVLFCCVCGGVGLVMAFAGAVIAGAAGQ